jgi:uncharacterized membrane protein YfcA
MVHFPVSGVEVNPLLPLLVSVLGFTSPAVSPTNLFYNVREVRVVWPLAWVVVLGTLPGAFVGAYLRITVIQ